MRWSWSARAVSADELRAHCAERARRASRCPSGSRSRRAAAHRLGQAATQPRWRLTAARRRRRVAACARECCSRPSSLLGRGRASPALASGARAASSATARSSQVRPSSVILACADANLALTRLHWTLVRRRDARTRSGELLRQRLHPGLRGRPLPLLSGRARLLAAPSCAPTATTTTACAVATSTAGRGRAGRGPHARRARQALAAERSYCPLNAESGRAQERDHDAERRRDPRLLGRRRRRLGRASARPGRVRARPCRALDDRRRGARARRARARARRRAAARSASSRRR